jgi:Phage capsid family
MNERVLRQRAADLRSEVGTKNADVQAGKISKAEYKAYIDRVSKEVEEIESDLKTLGEARKFSWGAEAAGMGVAQSSASPGPGELLRPVSAYDMTPDQLEQLVMAAKHRTPLRIEIAPKRYSAPVALKSMPTRWGNITTKAAVSESGITSAFSAANFPPLQSPHAIGIGLEPTRVAGLFPGYAYNRQAISWLTHTANSSASGAVAELGTKTDIGEEYSETTVLSTLIAGMASVSLQGLWDSEGYGEANLAAFIPFELQRDLVNVESNMLLNAQSGTNSATFNGLLNTAGTLTRAYSASGSLTPLDTIAAGINDMRTGAAFCFPDLALTSPDTLFSLRTAKDSTGKYLWNIVSGAAGFTADGQEPVDQPANTAAPYSIIPQGSDPFAGHLWGIPVAISTQVPDGTFVLCSVKNGGGLVFQRMGMVIEYNMWAENLWTTNTAQWRAEERLAFAVQRPAAVNIITGLPFI